MKILQINASYKPAYIYGGPTMSVSKLSEQLIKAGCRVEVFTTTANGPEELPVSPGIPQQVSGVTVRYFKRLSKDHTHFSPKLLLTLWKEVRSFDLVHIHAWWNLVSVLSCFIALLRKVPVVLSPRGTLSPYSFTNRHAGIKKIFHNIIGSPLLQRCHVHTTSEREETAITKLLRPRKIFNIYNLVNFPPHIPTVDSRKGPLRLLFLSRIEQKKGLELLFAALAKCSIPYHLTIAGDGEAAYIEALKRLARQYQIQDCITWVGFKTWNKFELIAQHQVLVLPSYDENFGNVVIESLSVGTAVLISKEVGLAGYVQQNNLGWVSDCTPISIQQQLSMIYQEPDKLSIIREYAPAMVVGSFNEVKLLKQYIDMYGQVIRRKKTND